MRNLHAHTYRCKHATGDASDYAREAAKRGIRQLGISDHAPLPDGRWSSVRMEMSELEGYEKAVRKAGEIFPELTVYSSLECEWAPEYHSYYEDLLGSGRFDYLIGAVHWIPFRGSWDYVTEIDAPRLAAYADITVKTIASGLFSFIAHPDVFGSGYMPWDENAEACARDILDAAEEYRVPMEINGLGFRKSPVSTGRGERNKYPLLPFWELASEYSIQVVCNSDAHRPEDVAASIEDAREVARNCGLDELDSFLPEECIV